ncbi:hypothetical protein GCM10023187_05470 [Nibrella viscosa]|uniref:GmrSD restriction endonucleases C-terminal domain-containing protein n=1 Tax=Nibrella viscosa TaxID=1084524 RepID=A0ABP8JWK8_9BACT
MTLMQAGQNRNLGNAPYAQKRQTFALSEFAITRKVAETYEDWGIAQIIARQRQMAQTTTGIWRVGQLS